jgi:hypothetical protein
MFLEAIIFHRGQRRQYLIVIIPLVATIPRRFRVSGVL